ncbi:MAG: TIGR00730 family Rossman fold protein [Acidobacteriota bacterium]
MPDSKSALLSYEDPGFINSPDGRPLRILAEYLKPLAHFRRERIQDTVVFFGSARFIALDEASRTLELLDTSGSATPASAEEQPATAEQMASGQATELQREHAVAAVEMAQYYEDARKLAYLLTQWSMTLRYKRHRFVVTSGGGPGIMEAANRGASEAGGKTIGLNIRLPFEQAPNPYITPSLSLDFHYFFMRKFWFAYLAKALVVFPGGFGTLDEMFELLTLTQTHKLAKEMTIVVYGSQYWNEVIHLDTLVKKGTISPEDVKLLHFADTPEDAFAILQDFLTLNHLGGKKPETGTSEEVLDEESEMSLRPEIRKTWP